MADEVPVLYDAIKSNDLELVKLLLETGVSINQPLSGCKYNALFLAVDLQRQELVDYLIEKGAIIDYEEQSYNYQTPLTFAIHKNYLNIVKLLVAKGANINKIHKDGDTPLTLAVRLNKLTIVEYLLQWGADVNLIGWKEKTPLMWAIIKNNLAAVQILTSYGADVKKCDHKGTTAIELAKTVKNPDIFDYLIPCNKTTNQGDSKMLVQKGRMEISERCSKMSVNKVDSEGFTPLLWAIEYGKLDAIQHLLSTGADVCQCGTDGLTPLLLAVRKRDSEIIKLLLDNGAEDTIHTAFLEAISVGDSEIVELLLENGALVNVVYNNGSTPLTKAIERENIDIIKQLVGNGANINMPDGEGNFPLTLAVNRDNLGIVKYLIDNLIPPPSLLDNCPFLLKYIEEDNFEMVHILVHLGVKLDVLYECGNTPLSKAVQVDNFKIVKYLVEQGANVNQSTASGKVPLAIAASNRNLRIVKFLIGAKADLDLARVEIQKYAKKNENFAIFLDVLRGRYRMWESNTSLQMLEGCSKDTLTSE